jgi:glucoamylase
MVIGKSRRVAPGGPGLAPRWTRGAKEAVGTAYSTASRVWYTVAAGILTEVFYPTIDTPQIRDLQYLMTDGRSFFHDERRNTKSHIDCVDDAALGFEIVNVADDQQYTIRKTLIGRPHQDCVLMRTRFEADQEVLRRLQVYVLCAPHLEIGGWHNNAEVLDTRCGRILVAFKGSTWMALGATAPLLRCSCGYVAVNDGWTDLHDNFTLDWQYDAAYEGNIAVTGQIDLSQGSEFTLGLAFGDTRHRAITNLFQSLVTPFAESLQRFREEWNRTSKRFALASSAVDRRASLLYERSVNLLLAHEDKSYPGAMIAALSIPWGSSKGDEELGGYHLVWTRDLVQSATALLAAGDLSTPLRVLVYLAVSQRADGGFYQNFWIDGRPYLKAVQLDEVSFPLVLAWRLKQVNALGGFNPSAMVAAACGFLIREGPETAQERWEEAAGYSPSTLAINIAALICAAELMDGAGDSETARFVREYADFLESHVDAWTVTTHGSLVPGVARHYIRINPNTGGNEDPNAGTLVLANQPPGGPYEYTAKDIVDGGFLELVRYGIRNPHDPVIEESLRVVDAVLKVETPVGPCWRRYNHDGYGQHADGTSYKGWGIGRLWPLLTGERGHYELAAGRDATPYLKALEAFAGGIGLIPEQIWDQDAIPEKLLTFGGPTGAAIPLAWAHAEYIKLVRSIADRQVFDRIEPVRARYASRNSRGGGGGGQPLEIWSNKRPIGTIPAGCTLRVIAADPFTLSWTSNEWHDRSDTPAISTTLGLWYVDLDTRSAKSLRFTFIRRDEERRDEREYVAQVTTNVAGP